MASGYEQEKDIGAGGEKKPLAGLRDKLNDVVGDIVDWMNEDVNMMEEGEVKMSPESLGEESESLSLTQKLEVIDPFDKNSIMELQKEIGMPDEEIDGVYGPMTDSWLKAHLFDLDLKMSDAARFNLGLNEFSESPAAEAYSQHMETKEVPLSEDAEPQNQVGSGTGEIIDRGLSEVEDLREGSPKTATGLEEKGSEGAMESKSSGNIIHSINNEIYDLLGTPEDQRWMGILSHFFDSETPGVPTETTSTSGGASGSGGDKYRE